MNTIEAPEIPVAKQVEYTQHVSLNISIWEPSLEVLLSMYWPWPAVPQIGHIIDGGRCDYHTVEVVGVKHECCKEFLTVRVECALKPTHGGDFDYRMSSIQQLAAHGWRVGHLATKRTWPQDEIDALNKELPGRKAE